MNANAGRKKVKDQHGRDVAGGENRPRRVEGFRSDALRVVALTVFGERIIVARSRESFKESRHGAVLQSQKCFHTKRTAAKGKTLDLYLGLSGGYDTPILPNYKRVATGETLVLLICRLTLTFAGIVCW